MITTPITAEGTPGLIVPPAGPQGLSAYQVWLSQGNVGTESNFIASLQGAAADPTSLNDAVSRATVAATNASGFAATATAAAASAATSLSNLAVQISAAVASVTSSIMQSLQTAVSAAAASATAAAQSAAAAAASLGAVTSAATSATTQASAASTSASASAGSAATAATAAAQANRLASGTNFIGASTTSLTPALGNVSLVLTAAAAQGFAPSAFMAFVSASDWTASMQGQFVSYDPKSGTLTLAVFALGPNTAATKADWTVVPTPPPYLPTAINGGSFTDPAPGTAVIPFTVAQSGTPTGVSGGTF